MFDVGTISLILSLGMFALLASGMPLGFASAFLAVAALVMKFGPDLLSGRFGMRPLNVLGNAVYRQMTNYVLISVPLFIFMAALLERSGIARDMYASLNVWLSRTRGGIAIVTSVMAVIMAAMSGIIGGEVVLLGLMAPAHISLTDIFRGFLPFIAIQLLALAVLLAFPQIMTVLLWRRERCNKTRVLPALPDPTRAARGARARPVSP